MKSKLPQLSSYDVLLAVLSHPPPDEALPPLFSGSSGSGTNQAWPFSPHSTTSCLLDLEQVTNLSIPLLSSLKEHCLYPKTVMRLRIIHVKHLE